MGRQAPGWAGSSWTRKEEEEEEGVEEDMLAEGAVVLVVLVVGELRRGCFAGREGETVIDFGRVEIGRRVRGERSMKVCRNSSRRKKGREGTDADAGKMHLPDA